MVQKNVYCLTLAAGEFMSVLEKVTAFITRGVGETQELLVFQHSSMSIQIPAGTVEEREEIETALWREVREETGLIELRLLPKLGQSRVALPLGQKVMLRSVAIRTEPNQASAEVGLSLRRGLFVYETALEGAWSQVRFEEYAAVGSELTAINSTVGWAPSDALTGEVVRHFFHLRCELQAPERWRCWGETDCEFELYWTPLHGDPGLVFGQAEWLAEFREAIIVPAGA